MHPELKSVYGDLSYECRQSCFCICREIIGGDTPHQPGYRMIRWFLITRYSPTLYAAPIDMVPDAGGETNTPLMRHGYQPIDRRQVAALFRLAETRHPDAGITVDVKKVRIAGRQESSILISKNHYQRIKAIFGQFVQVAGPILFIIEAAFPISAVHGIDGNRPGMYGRFFIGVFHSVERHRGIYAQTDLPGGLL